MESRPRSGSPSFFRQGLLIVLPALCLAGLGLFSLRQDRQLAWLEATEEAKRVARDLSEVYLPNAFLANLAGLEEWQGGTVGPFPREDDPLPRLAQAPERLVACLVNRAGELVYPPPKRVLPSPHPLPVEELDERARPLWDASQEVVHRGNDPVMAIELLQQLIPQSLPPALSALAHYQLGVLWQESGNDSVAGGHFNEVLEHHPTARSASGTPLATLAALRLLQSSTLAPTGSERARELEAAVARTAVWEPNLLSRPCLEALSHSERWLDWWRTHEQARALYRRMESTRREESPAAAEEAPWAWATLDNTTNHLLLSRPARAGRILVAISEPSVRELVERAASAATLSAYLGVEITVQATTNDSVVHPPGPIHHGVAAPLAAVLGANNGWPVLTDTALNPPSGSAPPRFRVRVFLSHIDALYARQRVRTWWFGGLIGVSLAGVLVGGVTARRAFRHQRELNEMKTNFVSSVSHELRAPIASVRLMAEELSDLGPEHLDKHRQYQRFIVQECRRLSGLIENVLDFARHEQGRKQYEFDSTDLEALVRETVRVMQTYAEAKGIAIQTVLRGEPEPIEADGRALQQVLVNLLDNAIKHSPQQAPIEVGLEFVDGAARLWVEDRGEGIPAEDHERIFERFYRRGSELRRHTQGVGLGLAIVKYATHAHGGRVTVRSAPGQGSRFTVILPLRHNP